MKKGKPHLPEIDHITRAEQLVLARLLVPAKGGLTAVKVAADLRKVDAERFSPERVSSALERLHSREQVEVRAPSKKPGSRKTPAKPPSYVLTTVGHDFLMRSIRLQNLPAKMTWPVVMELLLRIAVDATPHTPPLKTKPALAAYLIRRQFALDVPESAKLATVIAAMVCGEIGFPGISDYKTLEAKVLEKSIGTTGLTPKNATEQFIRSRLGSKQGKVGEIRTSTLREWLAGATPDRAKGHASERQVIGSAPSISPSRLHDGGNAALGDFARRAVDAAQSSDTGRFGDNKVFINHAWKSYCARGNGEPHLDLARFKEKLLLANTAGLLELSRADLVSLMDPADVRESETQYLNASFHFILLERGRP